MASLDTLEVSIESASAVMLIDANEEIKRLKVQLFDTLMKVSDLEQQIFNSDRAYRRHTRALGIIAATAEWALVLDASKRNYGPSMWPPEEAQQ